MSRDADVVAVIEQSRHGELPLRQAVLPDIHLNAAAAIREDEKTCLPEAPNTDDAPGRDRFDTGRLELLFRMAAVPRHELAHGIGGREFVRIWLDPELCNRRQVGA